MRGVRGGEDGTRVSVCGESDKSRKEARGSGAVSLLSVGGAVLGGGRSSRRRWSREDSFKVQETCMRKSHSEL